MSDSPFSINKFRFVFAGGWFVLFALHLRVLLWYNFSSRAAIFDSFISNGLLALIAVLLSTMFRFYVPRRDRFVYLFALSIAITALWFFISRSLLMLIQKDTDDYHKFFAASVPVRIAIGYLFVGIMTMFFVLWYTLNEQKENEKRKAEAEKLARDAELFNLRQQLQPHFLFNSLNSINALIGFKPEQARVMIQQLSDFLRGTLKKDNNQLITLEDELSHLQLYLDIEMVRFGHRLRTEIVCDEVCSQTKMPGLLLQPVVENAIKFGLYDTIGDVVIRIEAWVEENNLHIAVTNPFEPGSHTKKGTGFGLSAVQRRLYLLYARNGLLQTESNDNIFKTTLTIPQLT